MINPDYFTDRKSIVEFKINLDSHHINHANFQLTITPNHFEFVIEVRYNNNIVKEISVTYARLKNQYKFNNQPVISARLDKEVEDNQVLDETELLPNLNINHHLTETNFDNIDVKSPLEHQIQQQEMKNSA